MSTEKQDKTTVKQVEVDMEALIGLPGADDIMTAEEEEGVEKIEKPSFFSNQKPDLSFLDTVEKPEEEGEEGGAGKEDESEEDEGGAAVEQPGTTKKKKPGRPKGVVSVAKNLVEKGLLLPFDDDKKLEDYTEEDFNELFEMNIQNKQKELEEKLPEQFFGGMPEEMQQAYTYLANGGTDIKGMFKALASTVEAREIDITKEAGQKHAIRAYLQATGYGTADEIEEEITAYEDRGDLEKKAKQFKPKLDAMQESMVQERIETEAAQKKQRQKQAQVYRDSVYTTLEKGELNGLQMDAKVQNMLYAGLTQANYPSMSGRQTNMLGHLLEKYQWQEPRHDLIAEALWLLSDPDGYRKNITMNVKKDVNTDTMRKLKTEQGSQKGTGTRGVEEEEAGATARRTIKKPKRNFFAR